MFSEDYRQQNTEVLQNADAEEWDLVYKFPRVSHTLKHKKVRGYHPFTTEEN